MSEAAAPSPPDGAAPGAAAAVMAAPGANVVTAAVPGAAGPGTTTTVTAEVAAMTLGTAELGTAELGTWVSRLAVLAGAGDDAERVDQLRLLEEVKGACAAAQARVAVAFADSQLAAQDAAGVRARERGKGIAAQIALARRDSPHRGSRLLGLARALVTEMPHTLTALTRGQTSEWRATILARETACLSRADRAGVDADLGPRLHTLGDHDVETQARAAAYRADPHAFVNRSARAAAERTVTSRPAPDTMCRLSALLPVTGGVASYAALRTHALSLQAGGDSRSLGQIMADTLVERLTGRDAASPAPITLELLLGADTLLSDGAEPAHLIGYGPIPAPLARDLARGEHPDAQVHLRRLFTDPTTGALTAMESTARLFPENVRAFLVYRDQTCRTPYCGAPIRHADHVRPHAEGGPTSTGNGQGLCAACNHAKQAPGWAATPHPDGAGVAVTVTTPTGHTHTSTPPPPPATTRPGARRPGARRPGAAADDRDPRERTEPPGRQPRDRDLDLDRDQHERTAPPDQRDHPDRPDLYRHPRTTPNRRRRTPWRDQPVRLHVVYIDVARATVAG